VNDQARSLIAESLENLARQETWNSEVWQKCYDAVSANMDDELLAYVHDDLIHYDGLFHSRNILGFHVQADPSELADYRQEFRDVAAALQVRLSLKEAQAKYDF
jgi:hypothetical protein